MNWSATWFTEHAEGAVQIASMHPIAQQIIRPLQANMSLLHHRINMAFPVNLSNANLPKRLNLLRSKARFAGKLDELHRIRSKLTLRDLPTLEP
jgi:hypothetical protein